jgi:bacterioferritin-associated ferredoxin
MYVCICNVVTDTEIRDAVRNHTIGCGSGELKRVRHISNKCGICAKTVRAIINEELQIAFDKQTEAENYE